MPRRGYHQRKNSRIFRIFAVCAAVLCGLYYLFAAYLASRDINAQKILDQSELKAKNFSTPVTEVISPRKKIKAYLFEDKTNPIISMDFIFSSAGRAADAEDEQGIANMAASLLTDGAGALNRHEFKDELEDKAITISFSVDKNDFSGALLTTANHRQRAFELLRSALTSPRFAEEDISRVKEQMLMALKRQNEQPESVLSLVAAKNLYGAHPYGRNPVGEAGSIKGINAEKLRHLVKNRLNRSNLIVGIAGDISEEEAGAMLDYVFGDLPESGRVAFVREAKVDFSGQENQIEADLPQTVAMFANQGLKRSDPDFYPLYAANQIFGGSGLSSRLSLAAREKEGLTYSIYSYLDVTEKAPMIKGGFSATPENFPRVAEIVREQWQKMGQAGVTAAELEEAKNYLLASYNLRFASLGGISAMLAHMQKENLGIDFLQKRNDYIRNIKIEDVNKAAKKYFDNRNLRFEIIGRPVGSEE